MKVTQMSTYRSLSYQIEKSNQQRYELYEQATTGKRVNRSSDDPAAVGPILSTTEEIQKLDRYMETTDATQNDLDIVDGHLDQVSSLLIRAKEIAISGSNSSNSAEDMQTLAKEVVQLKKQLLDIANAKVDGNYLFSGYADKTTPFSGDPVVYNGTNDHKQVEVSAGQTVQTNLTGSELFKNPTDIFATIDQLEGALNSGDHTSVSNQLDSIESSAEQIRGARSQMGNINSHLDDVKSLTEEIKLQMQSRLSNYEDADIVNTLTEISQAEQSLEAALKISAQVSKLSLLNFM